MLENVLKSFADAKARYERHPARDPSMICRAGHYMDCAVVKLQKTAWTNDDLTKMGKQTGIFFSIWVGEVGAAWPNVSTDYGCCTLMQGWYDINPKSVASDALRLMKQFDNQVAPIIDR